MELFYSKDKAVEANIDIATKCMHIKWFSLMSDIAIEECCLAQLEEVKNGALKLIIDVSEAKGVPSPIRQEWFGSTLFPQFAKHGLKVVVTVLPKSAITSLASKKWMKTASAFKFEMFDTVDLSSAQELVKTF